MSTKSKEPKLYRYVIRSEKGEGWAVIVIGSDGYFSAVSDYGNYAFWWSHHGEDDARKFFLRAARHWSYFAGKLAHRVGSEHQDRIYDGAATHRAIVELILRQRREGRLSKKKAREEWEHLADCAVDDDGIVGFHRWYDGTGFSDAYEEQRYCCSSDLRRFCQETMAKLGELIRAELAAEVGAAPLEASP